LLRAKAASGYREPMAAAARRTMFAVAVPLAILVALLSVGAPGDAWGAPSPAGVTVHSSLHADHALAAPRRGAFGSEVERVVRSVSNQWQVITLGLVLLTALLAVVEIDRRHASDPPWPAHPRVGEPTAARRGPPLLLPI
jgi:hypothetical protein